ncbi:hypothetical protein AVEN_94674-1 [Araneus ventricosus]|uniref:Uncharacterized protein n=1 Tax=Araneus ventricosus TaxID=182803 RepID=A0A4Y2SPA3_ARAVE|nr:hypothetical protein AVEN_245403-1 [Araneus ventricosus]GBN89323.1 hypothetical protein AVEN_94674-1 [Araneus ventricosus]
MWASGLGSGPVAYTRAGGRGESLYLFLKLFTGPCFGNVHPIQLVSTPHIFVALGLVAVSALQQAVQQDMPGDIFWHFSCWAPGHSLSDNLIQARTDDRKSHCRELAGLYSAPHAPFDVIFSPSHHRTSRR